LNQARLNSIRTMIYKDQDQEYGQVIKILGDCRCEISLLDGNDTHQIIIGHIRGKMKKRCWINNGDYVLISFRDFQNDKCDIIHKYSYQEFETISVENGFSLHPSVQMDSTPLQSLVELQNDEENEEIDLLAL